MPRRETSKTRQLQVSREFYQLRNFESCLSQRSVYSCVTAGSLQKPYATTVLVRSLRLRNLSAPAVAIENDRCLSFIDPGASTSIHHSFHIVVKERSYHGINHKSNKFKSSTKFYPGSTVSSIAARNSPSHILQVLEARRQLGIDQLGIQRAVRHV